MISKNKKKGKSKMSKAEQENRIVVDHVYKTFNIYMDKANSLKEKLLFWNRNRKEKRESGCVERGFGFGFFGF